VAAKVIECLDESILEHFTDPQIVIVILEISALFTKSPEIAPLIFYTPKIIRYVFQKLGKLTEGDIEIPAYSDGNFLKDKLTTDIVRISALALCRLAASLTEENCGYFIKELKKFRFETLMDNIPTMILLTTPTKDENGQPVSPEPAESLMQSPASKSNSPPLIDLSQTDGKKEFSLKVKQVTMSPDGKTSENSDKAAKD